MAVRLLVVGPPGAGKGTQAARLCEKLGIPAISTGAIFRAHAAANDELGKLAASYTSRGELVPDEVTNRMVAARLDQPDTAQGFLLDGYPRNVGQVAVLDAMLEARGIVLDAVLELTADDDAVVERLLHRAQIEGRPDDTEYVIRHRIHLYHETTQPLIDIYRSRGILRRVDGMGSVDEVFAKLTAALDGIAKESA